MPELAKNIQHLKSQLLALLCLSDDRLLDMLSLEYKSSLALDTM